MIQKHNLKEEDFHSGVFVNCIKELKGNNDCLNITRPDIIQALHKEYIDAGADIITTNTFSSNKISQKEYDCEEFAALMAYEGAKNARAAADKAFTEKGKVIHVAGSIGPTSKSLSLAPDINDPSMRLFSFNDMVEAFSEQEENLIRGGVDIILLETCFDALNTKAALYALQKLQSEGKVPSGFPVIVSASSNDKSGRTLTGQTLEAFYTSIKHYPLLAFGINCSLGAEDMIPLVEEISQFCEVPVICYPNAGLPNEMGGYDETPQEMAESIKIMAQKGLVNVVGGCCGTTPDHIREEIKAVSSISPRSVDNDKDNILHVSGLEAVTVDLKKNNFTNIGERTNVAGSRKFAKLIAAGEYDTALQIAADQIENGASIIDINMDDAMLDSPREMEKFVRHISNDPAVAKAALMIDSSHWESILAGLQNAQGKCIVNSISLKEGEEAFLKKAGEIKALGAAMVVMAFDEIGQATTYDRKVEICSRAYDLLTKKVGVPPTNIIFDCNVLSIGTGIEEHSRYAIDFIEAVRWIKTNLPGALTSGGISNLSFAFRGNNTVREAMHSAFLFHAIKAGLDMGIVNPGMIQVYDDVEPELLKAVEDVIFNTDSEATERLIAKAQQILAQKEAQKASAEAVGTDTKTVAKNASERLCEALVKGKASTLEADVLECYNELGSAVKVIEGPLMEGMEKVGTLFGEGKMFLPQVVKSAKIMRDCVAVLQPYMTESEDTNGQSAKKPQAVNATAKGDVHDIGKNITGIVLGCNGFEVIDLGVMVDKETILDTAERENADIIGASGLITPSLFQMEEICREMTKRGMTIPLLIGGATTSALHTAVKLAPLYDHVFYGPDASTTAVMAKRIMMDRQKFEDEEHLAQEKIRAMYENRPTSTDKEEKDHELFPTDSFLKPDEHQLCDIVCEEIPIKDVLPFFDWRMFLAVWGFKYGETIPQTPQARKTISDGEAVIEKMINEGTIKILHSVKFFDAYSKGSTIILDKDNVIPMLRQEEGQAMSLADYVPSEASGMKAPFGMFAISVGASGIHPKGCDCETCRNEYSSMMERSVRVTLAEAASLLLDQRLKGQINREDVKVTKPAAGYASCPDHTLKEDILRLLPGGDRLGIRLTESYAMIPDASICGFIVAHPKASYPEIRHISEKQYNDYAKLRGMNEDRARQFLGNLR
ncbi:MAG: methionine synthase [Bacteroidales bacterium]|nr:methionine synthase [Bacteroidales bacterium]